MLQETVTGTDESTLAELISAGPAAVLALPFASSSALRPETVAEAWQERLLALNDHDELAGVAEIIRDVRYEAIGLMLDVLRKYEESADIGDLALRRAWFGAVRRKIAGYRATPLQPQRSMDRMRIAAPQPDDVDLRRRAASVLHKSLRLEFAGTPLPKKIEAALLELEDAKVGLFDAFALFFAGRIKDSTRFRHAVLAAPEAERTIFGVGMQGYLQQLFGIATTTAQRFDVRLHLLPEPAADPVGGPGPDLAGYWNGIALAVARSRRLSPSTLSAIASEACGRSLRPVRAAEILMGAAALLERVRTELAEHLDMDDAGRVVRALDEEGPARALALLADLNEAWGARTGISGQVASRRTASIVRLQGRLLELMFEYRHAVGRHVQAIEQIASDGEEARAAYVCGLIEALVRYGRDLGEGEPLDQAVNMCGSLLGAEWLQPGSRLWIDLKHLHGVSLLEQILQHYTAARATMAEGVFSEVLEALASDDDKALVGAVQLCLGRVRFLLGTRPTNANLLERAIQTLKEAAAAMDPERDPYQSAVACMVLGDALAASATGDKRKERLGDAASAFGRAQRTLEPEMAPFEWLDLNTKLGRAAGILAKEASDRKGLQRAVATLERGLQHVPPGLFALEVAETYCELGVVHTALATGAGWYEPILRAASAYGRALAAPELKSEKPHSWVQNKQKWAAALLRVAKEERNAGLAGEAIDGLRECLSISILEKNTGLHGAVHHDLGTALQARIQLVPAADDLEAAEVAFRRAMELRPNDKMAVQWAQSTLGLASVLCRAVRRDPSRSGALQEVAVELERALEMAPVQNASNIINAIVSQLSEVRHTLAGRS